MVLLDVDSKQSESALRGPPPTFVTEGFLKALRSIIHSKGMYVCMYIYVHKGVLVVPKLYSYSLTTLMLLILMYLVREELDWQTRNQNNL